MATLYVSFLGGVQYDVAKSPMGCETLTTSGTSTATTSNPGASIAVVFSEEAHFVNTGPDGWAVASADVGIYVPANVEREIAIGSKDQIAAITA